MGQKVVSSPPQASAALAGLGPSAQGQSSAQFHSNLLQHLAGAVYRCRNDADRTLGFISDGCFALTGYRADELIANRVSSLGALKRAAAKSNFLSVTLENFRLLTLIFVLLPLSQVLKVDAGPSHRLDS